MGMDPSPESSISTDATLRDRALHWLLLDASRLALAGGLVGLVALGVRWSIAVGVLAVGSGGTAATLFASGLTAGTITLVTVALSINQLILSRVFGSPNELVDRFDGTRDLRHRVETIAEEPSSPVDPAAFLGLIARTLRDRVERLRAEIERSDWNIPEDVRAALEELDRYGENIDRRAESRTAIVDILTVILGTEYARNTRVIEHVKSTYAAELSEDASAELDAVRDLLEAIAITRQFFKTMFLQRDFAHLSRLVASLGFLSLLTSIGLTLVYRTDALTIPPSSLPLVVSVGLSVILAPLLVFIVYVIRAATIAHRTVSVGPFVPPAERGGEP